MIKFGSSHNVLTLEEMSVYFKNQGSKKKEKPYDAQGMQEEYWKINSTRSHKAPCTPVIKAFPLSLMKSRSAILQYRHHIYH